MMDVTGLISIPRKTYRLAIKRNVLEDVSQDLFYQKGLSGEVSQSISRIHLSSDTLSKTFYLRTEDSKGCSYYMYVMGPEHRYFNSNKPYAAHRRYTIEEYTRLPRVPVNQDFDLAKIIVLGPMGNITYDCLTKCDPESYTVGTDPELDYMPNDVVKPVMVVSSAGFPYRVDDFLWLRLNCLSRDIAGHFYHYRTKFLPKKIFIDDMKGEDHLRTCKWPGILSRMLKDSR